MSLSPVFAGSDLHLVSIRGSNKVASSFKLCVLTSLLLPFIELWTSFIRFSSSSICKFSSFSGLVKGDPKKRLAKDEDLYGADLHRVNKNAFLGGVEETKLSLATCVSLSSLVSSVSLSSYTHLRSETGESPRTLTFLQYPNRKNETHLHKTGRNDPRLGFLGLQKRFFGNQRVGHLTEDDLDLPEFVRTERRTRTWPIQVTFGEDGSCVSETADTFLLRKNKGPERDFPLLLLPTLLLKNLINGGGNFSARLGLDIGFEPAFILLYLSV